MHRNVMLKARQLGFSWLHSHQIKTINWEMVTRGYPPDRAYSTDRRLRRAGLRS